MVTKLIMVRDWTRHNSAGIFLFFMLLSLVKYGTLSQVHTCRNDKKKKQRWPRHFFFSSTQV